MSQHKKHRNYVSKHKKAISRSGKIVKITTLSLLGLVVAGAVVPPVLTYASVITGIPAAATVNPDLTPFSATLGADQKAVSAGTTAMNTAISQLTANQSSLNNTTYQQAALTSIATQLTNVNTFISDLQSYISNNPTSPYYPNLTANIQSYITQLQAYQSNLSAYQTSLQTAITNFNNANNGSNSAYNAVATSYQNLLNNNYGAVTSGYNGLMKTNLYVRRTGTYNDNAVNTGGTVQSGPLTGITGYSPWEVTAKPTLALGNSKGQTASLPNPNTYNATTWDSSVTNFNSTVSSYQTALTAYQTALNNYYTNFAQTTNIDPNLTTLYNTANSNYGAAQTTYTNALNTYNALATTVTNNNTNGLYTMMDNTTGVSYALNQMGMLYSASQTILGTGLTYPVNSMDSFSSSTGGTSPDTLNILSSSGFTAGSSTVYGPSGNSITASTNPSFWTGGYFGSLGKTSYPAMSSQLAAYLDAQAYTDRNKGTFFNQLTNALGTTATAIQTSSDLGNSELSGAMGNPITDYLSSGRAKSGILGTATSGGNIWNQGTAGTMYGYGMPVFHQTKSWVTDSSGNTINDQLVPDPIPSDMDYPSLATLNSNATSLLATGTWNASWVGNATNNNTGVDNTPVTQTMIDNWNAALNYIVSNNDATFNAAINQFATAWQTWNSSNRNAAAQAAFQTAATAAATAVNAAYHMVYGNDSSLTDLQNDNNVFSNDLINMTPQQLAAKYGYRPLLAGMTSVIDIGYYNNIQWPAIVPGTTVFKQLNIVIGIAGNASFGLPLGFNNYAPYLTAPVQSVAPVAPPTQPVLTDLSFSAILPTPPDLTLDTVTPPENVLPFTGGPTNVLQIGSFAALMAAGVLTVSYVGFKKMNKKNL